MVGSGSRRGVRLQGCRPGGPMGPAEDFGFWTQCRGELSAGE